MARVFLETNHVDNIGNFFGSPWCGEWMNRRVANAGSTDARP